MKLSEALSRNAGPELTAAVAAWFQGLFDHDPPVLVGGAAVELYTSGAYRTSDLDFVGRISTQVSDALSAEGFERRGRHWMHEQGRIFIELPAPAFDRKVRVDTIRIEEWTVVLLSPEDVLVDRLAAWKFWRVPVEGINAYLLYRSRAVSMDAKRLGDIARAEDVSDALESLRRFGGQAHEPQEIEEWAAKQPWTEP
jgi:hypothetical protein